MSRSYDQLERWNLCENDMCFIVAIRTNHDHHPGDDNRKCPISKSEVSTGATKKVLSLTKVQTKVKTASTAKEIKNGSDDTKKSPPEKRSRRYRNSCPNSIEQRIVRSLTQRLFLIKRGEFNDGNIDSNGCSCEFHILGSTGNIYDVTLRKVATCLCPDHAKGNLCKHILFVLLKVISLD